MFCNDYSSMEVFYFPVELQLVMLPLLPMN